MNAGAIVYSILMQGAALFQKDADSAEKAMQRVGAAADKSTAPVSKAGAEIDATGQKAGKAKGPLNAAAKSTKTVGDESNNSAPKVKSLGQEFTQMDGKTQAAARTVGVAMVGIATAIALVGGMAVSKFAEFEVATDKTAAAANASASENRDLAASALELGAASQYSASQAAAGQTELVKAGVSVKDVLGGGLAGSLSLAAAGELEVARAAEIAATTLSVFKLEGKDAGHVADLLAAGAGKAQGSVDDLSLALGYVGPTFARLQVPLEDTVGTLALLASNGILGEKAGTGLRGTIEALTAPTSKASEVMKQYGINVFDAQGKFIGLEGTAEELKTGLFDLDEQTRSAALGAIFGAESANAAGTLYEAGAAGVALWTEKVDEQGYAARQAFEMTDNLTGDVERLGGAFDSALIGTGAAANDVLRDMVQALTATVEWYGKLDPVVQGTVLGVGGIASAALASGGAFLVAIPKIAEFRNALDTLQTSMPKTAAAGGKVAGFLTGPWGAALLGAAVVAGVFVQANAKASERVSAFTDSLDTNTGALTENSRQVAINELEKSGALKQAKDLGLSLDIVTDAALGNAEAQKTVTAAIDDYKKSTQEAQGLGTQYRASVVSDTSALTSAIGTTAAAVEESREKWSRETEAKGESAEGSVTAAEAYVQAADGAGSLLDQLSQLIDSLNQINGVGQDAVSTNAAYQQSLAEVQEYITQAQAGADGYTRSVDESTAAGSANADMFKGLAKDSQTAAEAQLQLDLQTMSSTDAPSKYMSTIAGGRQTLYDQIVALTGNADAAQALTDKVYGIPSEAQVTAIVQTAEASSKIDDFVHKLNNIPGYREVVINEVIKQTGAPRGEVGAAYNAEGSVLKFFANGGTENHVAQIARVGTMRVWAEPETGGEGYVPLAKSKRARSEAIMAEIAAEFGGRYIPAGASSFADGGISRTDSSVTSSVVQNFHLPPVPTDDPRAAMEVLGRAFARQAGR